MFLENLIINNFRAINKLEINFNKGINIIIGENNSGKTAIIDALRICFSYGKQWRDIGVRNDEDFYIDVSEIKEDSEPVEFHLYFRVETAEDRHYFNSMVVQNIDDPSIQHIDYILSIN
ncbi:MAG: AAA family ATPase [Bacteroidetes bacterium]|nr:AAA family ATPase [Bacteroidota bacterium]